MSVYREVPHSWFVIVGIVAFGLAIAATHVFPTGLPVWALLIAIILGTVFIIPTGILRAMTNQLVSLNLFSELVGGYVMPNKPVAVLLFKTFTYYGMQQSLTIVSDLKVGHYMKVPPRIMFSAQVVATVISSFVMYGTQEWLFSTIPDICTPKAKSGFTCPVIPSIATSSMVWGAIGPHRLFSHGAL